MKTTSHKSNKEISYYVDQGYNKERNFVFDLNEVYSISSQTTWREYF